MRTRRKTGVVAFIFLGAGILLDWGGRLLTLSLLEPYVGPWKDNAYGHFMRWFLRELAGSMPGWLFNALAIACFVIAVVLAIAWLYDLDYRSLYLQTRNRFRKIRSGASRVADIQSGTVTGGTNNVNEPSLAVPSQTPAEAVARGRPLIAFDMPAGLGILACSKLRTKDHQS